MEAAPKPTDIQRKIGVIVPTYRRPDFVRFAVLQWAAQSIKPDVIAVHQNGNAHRYDWAVQDLANQARIDWIHTPMPAPQHHWYLLPLKHLTALGCTHFFWADHDDIYRTDHIECCLKELEHSDITVAKHCGILYTQPCDYRYLPSIAFTTHAPGGMSSSMGFNRDFALSLIADIEGQGAEHHYTDNIVAKVTMPKFRVHISPVRHSTIYVSHPGSQTSASWLEDVFSRPA
jgi:hypothetical protein